MLRKFLLSLGIFLATSVLVEAQEPRDARLAAIRLTIAEAVLATNAQLGDRAGSAINEMDWSAELSDRNWSLIMRGSSGKGLIQVRINGFLWGNEAEDWVVNYSGVGQMGGEPILINGKIDWPKQSSDRLTSNFSQVTKFGEHSTWAWILGTEITVGVLIGGGAALVATSVAPPLAILAGLGGALMGANAAATLSNTIRNTIESDRPPPSPSSPPAPSPKKDDRLTPQADALYVAVTKDGDVSGNGPDPRYWLNGKTRDATMSGQVILR
jgi:hypothetical protein